MQFFHQHRGDSSYDSRNKQQTAKAFIEHSFYYTNHKIKTIFDIDENEHREMVSLLLIPYKKHPNGIKKIFKEYWLEFFDSVGWIDNLDEQCFMYDYNSFLNALNHTFRVISNNIRYDVKRKELSPCITLTRSLTGGIPTR